MVLSQQSLKAGFSVIELMFYTLIVGILLGGAVAGFNKILEKSRTSATNSSLRVIKQAVDTYYGEVQPSRYPETLEDLLTKPEGISNWDGPYLDAKGGVLPKDGWGADFVYERTPGGVHAYNLYSYGKKGEEAEEEDWISAW